MCGRPSANDFLRFICQGTSTFRRFFAGFCQKPLERKPCYPAVPSSCYGFKLVETTGRPWRENLGLVVSVGQQQFPVATGRLSAAAIHNRLGEGDVACGWGRLRVGIPPNSRSLHEARRHPPAIGCSAVGLVSVWLTTLAVRCHLPQQTCSEQQCFQLSTHRRCWSCYVGIRFVHLNRLGIAGSKGAAPLTRKTTPERHGQASPTPQ